MIEIPDELAATQSAFNGAAGRAFVAALPDLAAQSLERWGLRPDGPSLYGMCALVLPVVREADGRHAALKLQAVDEETAGEPVALRAWSAAGAGAVELLDHDPESGALLLERLDERRPLSGEADVREAVKVLGSVLARLVAVPAPEGLRTLGGVVERMLAAVPERVGLLADAADRRLLADCAAAVREVAGEPGTGSCTGTCTTTTSWPGARTRGGRRSGSRSTRSRWRGTRASSCSRRWTTSSTRTRWCGGSTR